MAAAGTQQPPPDTRTWRNHFPEGDLWVFGYGSLIWKPPPHYDQRVPGYIDGYVRRFWQASTDHRGTPEVPGRVVTVIERQFWEKLDDPLARPESPSSTLTKNNTKVWGAAYHIPSSHASEVHDYLDEREIDGYSVHYTPFYPFSESGSGSGSGSTSQQSNAKPITCMVYIGQPTNPQFLRDAARREQDDVARVISGGVGQSGKNTEYLYLLEKALQGLGLGRADEHVTDLVRRVKGIEGVEEGEKEEEAAERDLRESLRRAGEV